MRYFDVRKVSVNLWQSAAGETHGICTFPPTKRGFYWRASIVSIVANGEFFLLPDMERIVTLLEGGEILPESTDCFNHTLKPFQSFAFATDQAVEAKLTAGQMSMDFSTTTRLDICKAKARIAERTFAVSDLYGGVAFVIDKAWQLGDKSSTTDQGTYWFDGRYILRLLQPQGKPLFNETNWLVGHSPDQVQ